MPETNIIPIFQIYGVTRISDREIGDDVINEDVWDTYMFDPGARMLIDKPNHAMFHNGFNEDVDKSKVLEIMQGSKYKDIFGFAAIVVEDENVQAWYPLTNGIGFEMIEFDDMGLCQEIRITVQAKIGREPAKQFNVSRADPESGFYDGFYLIRTLDGPPGERGLSKLLNLVDLIRAENSILLGYADYADIQGVAHPLYRIKGYDTNKDSNVDDEIKRIEKGEAVIIDLDHEYSYVSPQANAYDPTSLLNKMDELIAREIGMNKHMLTGDPEGHLTSSITAVSTWYASIKEMQESNLPQIRPILEALGCTEQVQFNSPEEYSLEQMANGMLLLRKAMEGLIKREQIVNIFNEKFGFTEDKKLELAPEEEWNMNQNNEEEGTKYEYRQQSGN